MSFDKLKKQIQKMKEGNELKDIFILVYEILENHHKWLDDLETEFEH